jgi:hypothetical protein
MPLPKETLPAMEAVPYAFFGMGGVMLGLSWIIKRRMKLSGEKSNKEDSTHE